MVERYLISPILIEMKRLYLCSVIVVVVSIILITLINYDVFLNRFLNFNQYKMSKADAVKNMIGSDKVVIFSKTYCPYCKMAKEVFDKLGKPYTAVELDNRDDGDEIQSILGEITGARSVPRVFVNGEFIGGGTDVKALYESGQIQKYF